MLSLKARKRVNAQLDLLNNAAAVDARVAKLSDLVDAPDADPWRPELTSADDLAALLAAAVYVPAKITVRAECDEPADAAERARVAAGFRRMAEARADAAWREALAVRSEGIRQFPWGFGAALVAAVAAYGFGYLATSYSWSFAGAVFAILAALFITIAWVASWMVAELSLWDWRDAGRRARCWERLAEADILVLDAKAKVVVDGARAQRAASLSVEVS